MKIWILHDTQYGNGEKIAEKMGEVLGKKAEIQIGHDREVSPKKVAQDKPDAIVLGTAMRMFMVSGPTKRW